MVSEQENQDIKGIMEGIAFNEQKQIKKELEGDKG